MIEVPADTACVVVGGGLAGMTAARRLQQLDSSVLVLEKGVDDYGHNNARISGGLVHLAWRNMEEDPAELKQHLLSATDREIDPDLAEALAANAGRAISWLAAEGVRTAPKGDRPYQQHALYPHRPGTGRRIAPEFGPDRMMRSLYEGFRGQGGHVMLGARAHAITSGASARRWRVHYRQAGREELVDADAIVVADGGFQANAEMLSAYVGPNAALCVLRAWPSAVGDGLRMLLEHRAATAGLGRVYGHMVSRDALHNDTLWPYPSMDKLCQTGLLVDRRGDRVAVSGASGEDLVTRLARGEDPRGCSVIVDEEQWSTAGRDNPYNTAVPNPDLEQRGGRLFSDPTIEGLAGQLGTSPDRLRHAIESHNRQPETSAIVRAPYYAAPVAPGITFTMGGVRIDRHANVLDLDGEPIAGLYAAGSSVGGVHGGPRGGYVGGLAVAIELGLLAAEHASGADVARAAHTAHATP